VVESGFDDALAKYMRTTPPTLTNAVAAYYDIASPYLDKKIRES